MGGMDMDEKRQLMMFNQLKDTKFYNDFDDDFDDDNLDWFRDFTKTLKF